jgi:hypothetical protein
MRAISFVTNYNSLMIVYLVVVGDISGYGTALGH